MNTNISITTVVQSEVTLPCDIIPDPTVTFAWQFSGVLINPRGGTYTILPDGSLMVANVGEVHEGTYTCVVTNPLGVASGTVILTVNSKRAPLDLLCTMQDIQSYCIAGNFRGRKLSRILRFFSHLRRFSPRNSRHATPIMRPV